MITPRTLQNIRNQLRRNRRPTAILLILPRIRKTRHNSRDPSRRCDLACVDSDQQFHEHVVDGSRSCLNDEYVGIADGCCDRYAVFAVGEARAAEGFESDRIADSGIGWISLFDLRLNNEEKKVPGSDLLC